MLVLVLRHDVPNARVHGLLLGVDQLNLAERPAAVAGLDDLVVVETRRLVVVA